MLSRMLLVLSCWIALQSSTAASAPTGDRDSTALAEMARAIEAEPVPGSRVEQERSMLESLYPASWRSQRSCHCGSTAAALTVLIPEMLSTSSALLAAPRSNFSSIRACNGRVTNTATST